MMDRNEHETGRGHDGEDHDDFGGLHLDLPKVMDRRRALFLVGGGLGALTLAACGSSATSVTSTTVSTIAGLGSTTTTSMGADSTPVSCTTKIASETAGPYPGDGTNGPDVLTETGVVREDITSSFGSMSGSVTGVPLTVKFKVLNIAGGCTPYAGAAVYAWHCDAKGQYSLYSRGVTDQNWLRGVQEADADGWVTFQSIFPGCYPGRWPHIHFEVFPTLAKATNARNKIATSQIALPQDACEAAYATDGYSSSVTALKGVSLQRDNVFSDGWQTQHGTVTGDAGSGMTVTLNVPV